MSWYGKGQSLGGPLGPKLKELLVLPKMSDTLSLQALLRWRAYLLHTCLPLRVSPKAWPPTPCPPEASLMRAASAALFLLSLWSVSFQQH